MPSYLNVKCRERDSNLNEVNGIKSVTERSVSTPVIFNMDSDGRSQ